VKKVYFLVALFPLLGCSHVTSNDHPYKIEYNTPTQQMNYSNEKPLNTNNKNVNMKNKPIHYTSEKHMNIIKQKVTDMEKSAEVMSQTKMINVPLINQNPELRYGCEVTSLAMVLNYAGVKVNKMELYKKVKKDSDPIKRATTGDILHWGNPHEGFVGDMTGRNAGYAVFDIPIAQLVNQYLPNRAVNLTNQPFENVLQHVSKGYPVVVWTTGDYRLPDRWESWRHGNQVIRTPLDLHAVVLVGYNQQYVFLNDPLSGKKQVKVNKQRFIDSWKALKSRAVSYH
jgi:uncharacterized protein YvpB